MQKHIPNMSRDGSQTKRKRDATTGSTAEVHLSKCCNAKVLSVQGWPKDEGTHYWQCSKCGKPCDIKSNIIMSKGGRGANSIHEPNKVEATANAHLTETVYDKSTKNKDGTYTLSNEQSDWEKEFQKLFLDDPYEKGIIYASGDNVKDFIQSLLSTQRQEILGEILKHNKDEMTGLYDYDGIALEVISLVKK